jgi:NTF2-related export protein 1/2
MIAAQQFVDRYYTGLSNAKERATLASFYIQPSPLNPIPADITLNGNIIPSPVDLQNLFLTTIGAAHYVAQSFDCHVLNPDYNIGADDASLAPNVTGKKMSLALVVSGYVKYGELKEAKMRGFTENFVLVPNFQAAIGGTNAPKWLIQSQNFRLVH